MKEKKLFAIIKDYKDGEYSTRVMPIGERFTYINYSSPLRQELESQAWSKGKRGLIYFTEHTVSIEFEER
jgi:hypothetical protein